MIEELPANVSQFIEKTSSMVGKIEASMFSEEMTNNLFDKQIESPIEQLFWVAFHSMCKARYEEVNPEPWNTHKGEIKAGFGVFIKPQAVVDKYRVDFLISQNGVGPSDVFSPTIIELDGHEFHDKDKHQRAYEKSRDRFFVKAGYRVLHFTGSEVVADPFKVAFEAMEAIGLTIVRDEKEYKPLDPFNTGD